MGWLLACAAVAALAPARAGAADVEAAALERLESPATAGARVPEWVIAPPGGGGALAATWLEPAGGGALALRIAELEEGGFGAARTVVATPELLSNWADFPRAARTASGGVLVAFLARRPKGGHAYDLRHAWRGADEETWGAPTTTSSDDQDVEHGFVSLAPLGEERVAALWLDGRATARGGATALYLATLEQGRARGERALDERVCDCCQTALVRLEDGTLLAAWRDRGEGETRDIAFARGRAGEPDSWTAPRPLHADGWVIAGCPVNGPALAAGGGRVAAAWFTLGADATPRVLVAEYEPAAGRFGAPRRVDAGAAEGRVALAALADGRLFVSWMERVDGAAEWRLRELPRGAGEPAPPRAIAAVPLTRESGFLRLAARGGELYAAWTEPDGARFARLDVEDAE